MFALVRPAAAVCALVAVLALAVPRPSGGAGPEEQYVVRAGDTLWELADDRYGGDPREAVWRIRERNGLGAETLQPGTVLYLPATVLYLPATAGGA